MSADEFPETRSDWGRHAQTVCSHVLDAWYALPEDDQTERRLRSMLREAYPFHERANHPYQVWLKQQQVTLWLAGFAEMPSHVKATQPAPYVPPKEQMAFDLEVARCR